MSDYKFLVATDMDYTLLLPGQPVSQANKRAVEAVYKAGGCVTLATGRTFYLTGSYARDLGIKIPLITSNGAAISDPVLFKDVKSVDFPADVLKALITLFINENVDATGYSSDGLYFFENSSRRGFIADYNASVPDEIKVPELNDLDHSFNKFLLIRPSSDLISRLRSFPELEIVSSAKDFYDVMMKGTSKGLALKEIAKSLGVGMTFALGDSENDLSLLQAADYAIAMKDSSIVKHADYIAPSCESDGFAKAVFDFILPKAQSV
ncbi:MAG: HAD family hydrolase [Clostridiales bacterium]|nr:HAD family hydrolase [Clostridiales bacterium]